MIINAQSQEPLPGTIYTVSINGELDSVFQDYVWANIKANFARAREDLPVVSVHVGHFTPDGNIETI